MHSAIAPRIWPWGAFLHQCGRYPSKDIATLSFDEQFGLLVAAEYLHRENRRLQRRLSEAKLRQSQACIEDFDQPAKRGIDKLVVQKLATCQWIADHLNVVITGPTGLGKTYLASALGQRACRFRRAQVPSFADPDPQNVPKMPPLVSKSSVTRHQHRISDCTLPPGESESGGTAARSPR